MKAFATIAGISIAGLLLATSPAAAQWTGCGGGVHGGLFTGALDIPGPVDIGSNGQAAGVNLGCDYKMNAFVAGLQAEYSWLLGDAKTLGAKTDLSVLARLGVLINNGHLIYFGAGWSQIDTNFGHVDGWKIRLGNEVRIPNSPLYLGLTADYGRYDVKDIVGPTAPDVNTLTAMARLTVKFGPGMFGGKGAIFDDGPAPVAGKRCDPKMANC